MIRLACDSDQLDAIVHTPLIFTYSDLFHNRDSLRKFRDRFPGSIVKLIDRGLGDPLQIATIANVEERSLTPVQGANRIKEWIRDGRSFPTAYGNRSTMPSIDALLIHVKGWWRWYATLDGTMRVSPHRNAMVQFAGEKMTGGHYDMSIVYWDHYHPQG